MARTLAHHAHPRRHVRRPGGHLMAHSTEGRHVSANRDDASVDVRAYSARRRSNTLGAVSPGRTSAISFAHAAGVAVVESTRRSYGCE